MGLLRHHQCIRYRNFRTLTSEEPVQFTSLAIDHSGEVVCAGTMDPFDIYVWSLQTGKILDMLSGHEGPVVCTAFGESMRRRARRVRCARRLPCRDPCVVGGGVVWSQML